MNFYKRARQLLGSGKIQILGVGILALLVVGSFQNCAPGKVQTGTLDPNLNSFSSEVALPCTYSSIDPQFSQPNGLTSGSSVIGFPMSAVLYPVTCGAPVTRTCQVSGNWDGVTPLYASCIQQCVHPDTSSAVNAGTHYVSYIIATGTEVECNAAKVDSICDQATGQFVPALPTGTRFPACGVRCAYPTTLGNALPNGNTPGSTVSGFKAQAETYPNLCANDKVTRTCGAAGLWDGAIPVYTSCTQKCINPATMMPVDQGTAFGTFFTIDHGTSAECAAAKVDSVCQATTGLFNPPIPSDPTSRFATCTEVNPPVIAAFAASATTITEGDSVTLSWTVTGATNVTLSDGMNNVAFSGNSVTLSPKATTTYTLSATFSSGGFTSTAATSSVKVTVNALKAPVISSFTSSRSNIKSGDGITLSWNVTGENSIQLDTVENTVVTASEDVTNLTKIDKKPTVTTGYRLRAKLTNGTASSTETTAVLEILVRP